MPDNNYVDNKIVKFERRKNEIEAIRIREDNLTICAKWTGGKVLKRVMSDPPKPPGPGSYFDRTGIDSISFMDDTAGDPVLVFPTLDGPVHAFLNDWLIKDEDGKFSTLGMKEFKEEYAVPKTTPAHTAADL